MAKHIITVPNKDFNDVRIGVRFTNGVGETDDINIAKRMKNDYGYDVSGLAKVSEEKPEAVETKAKKSTAKTKSKKTKKTPGKPDMPEAGDADTENTGESKSDNENSQG